MIELSYLQTFLAVAEKGNFTKAAEFLNVSKGMVSRHVESLEAQVGSKLFHRTTRKVALTEAGQVLLLKAQQIRTTAREAEIAVSNVTSEIAGSLKVTAPSELAHALCRDVIPGFLATYPSVQLQIDAGPTARDIEAGDYDLALRAIEVLPDNVIGKPIGVIRNVLVASPGLFSAPPQVPDDLIHLPYVANNTKDDWNRLELVCEPKGARQLEFAGSISANSYQAILELVLQKMGFASLPYYQAEQRIKAGELIHLLPDWSIRHHPLSLIYAKQMVTPQKVRAFNQAILSWVEANRSTYFLA